MIRRRSFVLAGLSITAAAILPLPRGAWSQNSPKEVVQSDPAYILGATAITEVYGDGQRLTAVAIEYDRPVEAAALDPALFAVDDRTITRIYANSSADLDAEGAGQVAPSRFVIIELSPEDKAARLYAAQARGGIIRRPVAATLTITLTDVPEPRFESGDVLAVSPGQDNGQPQGGPPGFGSEPLSLPTTATRNLIVDDFVQAEFQDAETGDTLAYNLFVPRDRDPSVPLPLVLFMHDAGATSTVVDTTLVQGLGAVSWASPEDQARQPIIVLAPQYRNQIVNDESQTTSMMETTLHLLDHIAEAYNADRSRLYTTGQSGGGMMSIAMMVKEPDLFAAAFLVACQWGPAVVAPLAQQKLWVMVSEGDPGAFPGQNAIMEVIEEEGTEVSRTTWDGTSTPEQFAALVAEQQAKGAPVNYTVLRLGTVVPEEQAGNPGSDHMNTWRIAYTIPGIRDWIKQQSRNI
ncbi:prolyl oligopeptidase family serine peptidase [Xanthobacter sp. VTT E-85241]|uniref:prolyl oligopeptidase family serine peptidase n=1 Tax=Roseixanthobacter finlandensis TaxID=3119922 RepID=UPI00372A23B0